MVVTIMSSGCVSEEREREAEENEDEGTQGRGVRSSKGEMGEGCVGW